MGYLITDYAIPLSLLQCKFFLSYLSLCLIVAQFKQKESIYDKFGKPALTAIDKSNPWWNLLEEAVRNANGKLANPEIFPASTDARYFRNLGLPAIGFSPMVNTPILLHDHNEVRILFLCSSVEAETFKSDGSINFGHSLPLLNFLTVR